MPAVRVNQRTVFVHPQAAEVGGGGGDVGLYARVSSHDQRDDLDRQVAQLSEWAAQLGATVVRVETEVGSGMNGARRKVRRLLADPRVASLDSNQLGEEELAAPHLIDSEVTHVLRGLVRRGVLSEKQGGLALEGFTQLTLSRFPGDWLRPRMWALRHNLSAYDATYVALAEMTDATALLTTDVRLANAAGPECHIELLRPLGSP